MTPANFEVLTHHAEQLADHGARIKAQEGTTERIEGKLDKLIWGIGATLVGILIQIALKVWK